MHKGRARIYEIPLYSDDIRKEIGGNPYVVVYASRAVVGHPFSWKITNRQVAAKTLRFARSMKYDITRRYLD